MGYKGLIAGLGNPGREYQGTRHNCGFMLVDALLENAAGDGSVTELNGKKFTCDLWRVEAPWLKGEWLVAKPLTFMNDSGCAIKPLLAWHDLSARQLLVAQDELDIPAGALRFKFGGGIAGHNGLLSICQHLGTPDFYRLRIGIGKPASKEDALKWVLGRPAPQDREKIGQAIKNGVETIHIFIKAGVGSAAAFARNSAI